MIVLSFPTQEEFKYYFASELLFFFFPTLNTLKTANVMFMFIVVVGS